MKTRDIIVVLCSELGKNDKIVPLTPMEWRVFEQTLLSNNVRLESFVKNIDSYRELKWPNEKITYQRLKNLLNREVNLGFEIANYSNIGIDTLTLADNEYPYGIKEKITTVWPPLFYYAGNLKLLGKRNKYVGFVGSRDVSERDVNFLRGVVKKLPQKYGVVSGGAAGIDTFAIEEALKEGRNVIVYVADNMVTKLRNPKYINAIHEKRLLMLSAAIPRAGFSVGMAMARNKLIYTQSEFTVVVKSKNKGGTWQGAIENLKHRWVPLLCWNNFDYIDNQELLQKGALPLLENWDGELGFLKNFSVDMYSKNDFKQVNETFQEINLFPYNKVIDMNFKEEKNENFGRKN